MLMTLSPLQRDLVEMGAALLAAVAVAAIAHRALTLVAGRLEASGSAVAGDSVRLMRQPVALLILLSGLYMAAAQVSGVASLVTRHGNYFEVLAVLIVLVGLTKAANRAVVWVSQQDGPLSHCAHASLLRKVAILVIWVLGTIQILLALEVRVTPALASLGVAGLAVGLALQDTLANLFAGFYTVADRSVNAGDYIKLETGEEGFVEAVGWRNTRIRLWSNNIVVIPNAKLTQSVITNMTLPDRVLSVYTWCGVSYDSDLERVEAVALDVARDVLQRFPGGDLSYDPVLRYKEFADSNINFVVIFRAEDVGSQYLLQHEFIKALHKRFKEQDIEISYPVRKVVTNSAEQVPHAAGGAGFAASEGGAGNRTGQV